MPTARAIRYKSGLTPATRFVLFASIPIAFPTQQQHTLCRPHMQTQEPKPTQRVSLPQPVMNDEDWFIESQR